MNKGLVAILAGVGLIALWWFTRKDSKSSVNAERIGSDIVNTDSFGTGIAALSRNVGAGSSVYVEGSDGRISVNPEIVAYRLEFPGYPSRIFPASVLSNSDNSASSAFANFNSLVGAGWKPFVVFSDGTSKPLNP